MGRHYPGSLHNHTDYRKEFTNKIQKPFLINNPCCFYCGEKAEHVHHIIPLSLGGDNRKNNLVSICLNCHGLIHQRDFTKYKELQKAGIEKAKSEGKYKGGKRKNIDENLFNKLVVKWQNNEIPKVEISRQLNISRPTVDKKLKEKGLMK